MKLIKPKKNGYARLANAIDEFLTLDEQSKELAAIAKEAKQYRDQAEEHLLQNFTKDELSQVRKGDKLIYLKRDEVANVNDWDALYKYIARTKSYDLLQRRVSITAVRERWADKKQVPGVESFTRVSLQVRRT